MSQNKFIHFWRTLLANKLSSLGRRAMREIPRVQLIPVQDALTFDPMRIKEIGDIVAQIILLGRSRKRSAAKQVEVSDAA